MDRFREQIEEYLDGVFTGAEQAEFDSHFEACDDCRRDLAECRTLRRIARAAPAIEPPAGLGARIRARVESRRRRPRLLRHPAVAAATLAAAAVLLIVFIPRLVHLEPAAPLTTAKDARAEDDTSIVVNDPAVPPDEAKVPGPPVAGRDARSASHARNRSGKAESAPPASRQAVLDWLDQAKNASPTEVARLVEEARALGLLAHVREAVAGTRGIERHRLLAVEDLLIQIENRPSAVTLCVEAGLVARLP